MTRRKAKVPDAPQEPQEATELCEAMTAMVDGVLTTGSDPCTLEAFHAGLHSWQRKAQTEAPTVALAGTVELNPRFHTCGCGKGATVRVRDAGSHVDYCAKCYADHKEPLTKDALEALHAIPSDTDLTGLTEPQMIALGAGIVGARVAEAEEQFQANVERKAPDDEDAGALPEELWTEFSVNTETGEVTPLREDAVVEYFENLPVLAAPAALDPHERLSQLAAKVLAENGTFRNAGRIALEAAYRAGEYLSEAKVIVAKMEGVGWEEWCRGEAGIPERTAQRYMQWFNMASPQKLEALPADMGLVAAMKALSDEKRQERQAARHERVIPHYVQPADCEIHVGDAADLPWPGESVDLIFTSPPYGLALFEQDDPDQYDAYMEKVEQWCAEMYRVAGWQGRVVVNVALDTTKGDSPQPLAADWTQALINAGFSYRSTIMWNEGTVKNAQARGSVDSPRAPHVFSSQEVLIVVHKGPWALVEPDGKGGWKARTGETEFATEEGHAEWVQHTGGHGDWIIPQQSSKGLGSFPDELARRVIQIYTFRGDVVADPFAGWGTTPIVAASMGRLGWGVEKDPRRAAEAQENAHNRLGERP